MRSCLTQERYHLRPQDPDDYERATTRIGSEAKRLEDMTTVELLALQAELEDGDPGNRSNPTGAPCRILRTAHAGERSGARQQARMRRDDGASKEFHH